MIESDIEDYVRWFTAETEWMDWDAPWENEETTPEAERESWTEYFERIKALPKDAPILPEVESSVAVSRSSSWLIFISPEVELAFSFFAVTAALISPEEVSRAISSAESSRMFRSADVAWIPAFFSTVPSGRETVSVFSRFAEKSRMPDLA